MPGISGRKAWRLKAGDLNWGAINPDIPPPKTGPGTLEIRWEESVKPVTFPSAPRIAEEARTDEPLAFKKAFSRRTLSRTICREDTGEPMPPRGSFTAAARAASLACSAACSL